MSRASARRYLTSDVAGDPGVVRINYRTVRPTKHSAMSKKALERVWVLSGCQCGKYLAASMRTLLDCLQAHGELVPGKDGYSEQVRGELLAMSASTIEAVYDSRGLLVF